MQISCKIFNFQFFFAFLRHCEERSSLVIKPTKEVSPLIASSFLLAMTRSESMTKIPCTMKKVEVKNFKLYTTAVISIEWKGELLNVNLDLAMMLKMMHMEGLTEENIQYYSQAGQPILFKKVTLILFQDDDKPGQYYTDESFEEDDDPTVFYVEIKE